MLLAKLVETDEELVINHPGIVEESTTYGMDSEDAFIIKG